MIPRNPAPQPLPPANPNSVATAFPLQSSQFFGSLRSGVGLPSASGITDVAASPSFRSLFKREKKDSLAIGTESEGSEEDATGRVSGVAKREIDAESTTRSTDGKVRVVGKRVPIEGGGVLVCEVRSTLSGNCFAKDRPIHQVFAVKLTGFICTF